jgi:hypothetical protein
MIRARNHDIVVQDEPERRGPSGAFIWMVIGWMLVALVAAGLWYAKHGGVR